jgi:hypothetical protein
VKIFDNILYYESYSISGTTKEIQRVSYGIFDVFGYIGGIIAVFVALFAAILVPYS